MRFRPTKAASPSGSSCNDPSKSTSTHLSGSRPGSSACSLGSSQAARDISEQSPRSGSATSSSSTCASSQHFGQCRICRKFILKNEPYHLCSNCNQFICEDCASYSTRDKHWMCSSCRRRNMQPASATDALRELGLNPSPSRRMVSYRRPTRDSRPASALQTNQSAPKTLRTLQAEPTGSHPGNTPSGRKSSVLEWQNSSSLDRETPLSNIASERQGQIGVHKRHDSGAIRPPPGQPNCEPAGEQEVGNTDGGRSREQCDQTQVNSGGCITVDATVQQQQQHRRQPEAKLTGRKEETWTRIGSRELGSGDSNNSSGSTGLKRACGLQQQQQQQRQQQAWHQAEQQQPMSSGQKSLRRVADSERGPRTGQQAQISRRASVAVPTSVSGSTRKLARDGSAAKFVLPRKQSIITFYAPNPLHRQRQAVSNQQPSFYSSSDANNESNLRYSRRSIQLDRPANASGSFDQSRHGSNQNSPYQSQSYLDQEQLLIPIPPDQIHLRRLSDQSTLVRRSSIIADTLDVLAMARNRSHSNIDSLPYHGYFNQQQQIDQMSMGLNCSEDKLHQRQLETAYKQNSLIGGPQLEQQEPLISAVITSYALKQPHEAGSNSSSDLEDGPYEFEQGLNQQANLEVEQPSKYFAPPRAISSNAKLENYNAQAVQIPSVSVSEFQSNLRRQSIQQNSMLASPTRVNVAIENAIRRQSIETNQENSANFCQLPLQMQRRSSGGRLLPRIPADQSRSLSELSQSILAASCQLDKGQFATQNCANQFDRLELPAATCRRASAPEGQNIKIVVDDIDSLVKANRSTVMDQNGLCEKLVLYRDDSIDPATSQPRGFGLRVMGGKLSESHEDKLEASIAWTLPGGPADKAGLRAGDKIIEWDGKVLVNMSYEQVGEVIESSANIAELIVKPALKLRPSAGLNLVKGQRRLSQQTECDLRKMSTAGNFQDNSSILNSTGLIEASQNSFAAGSQRAGTGRKLPQIPPLAQNTPPVNETMMNPVYIRRVSSSTGQLERDFQKVISGVGGAATTNGQYLNTNNQQQQSSSASELASQGKLALQAAGLHYYNLAPADDVCGSIGLQVSVDDRIAQLEIAVLSIINRNLDESLDYYVRIRILPDGNRFQACMTQPSSSLEWRETFILQNFPVQQLNRMALEVSLWVYEEFSPESGFLSAQPQLGPICEALISLQSARERNTDFWPLRPSPNSSHLRRKSLNDLMDMRIKKSEQNQLQFSNDPTLNGPNYQDKQQYQYADAYESSANLQQNWSYSGQQQQQASSQSNLMDRDQLFSEQPIYPSHLNGGGYAANRRESIKFHRQRSSSNRNLPTNEGNRFKVQPRRASDEVAASSSSRLSVNRVSPSASRRSISVINVYDSPTWRLNSRPGSRMSSQQLRQQQQQMGANQQYQHYPLRSQPDSPDLVGKLNVHNMGPSGVSERSWSGNTTLSGSPIKIMPESRGTSQVAIPDINRVTQPVRDTKVVAEKEKLKRGSFKDRSRENTGESDRGARGEQLQRKNSLASVTFRKLIRKMSFGSKQQEGSRECGEERRDFTGSHLG